MLTLINPVPRVGPFDHPDWLFEPKFDGFRAAADTVRGRLISHNGMTRFEAVSTPATARQVVIAVARFLRAEISKGNTVLIQSHIRITHHS